MKKISIKLNGETRYEYVEPNDILLSVIRDKLGIKSPKSGCERGDCGACEVFLNGKSVKSCLILAIEVDGQEITTIEGLAENGLTPLQESFIKNNSFQCGFCASGVTIAATELLNHNPKPTKEEIQEAIAGNLCRCTGYDSIIKGVQGVTE
ncbi:(2Fe-2S)-binding protein [Bacteroidota bacterium]